MAEIRMRAVTVLELDQAETDALMRALDTLPQDMDMEDLRRLQDLRIQLGSVTQMTPGRPARPSQVTLPS